MHNRYEAFTEPDANLDEVEHLAIDRLLSVKDCAALMSCHTATIWRMVKTDQFPRPLRVGHLTRWSELHIQRFLARTRASNG